MGTTVKLYLPRADVEEAVATHDHAVAAPEGAGETVLVVEDDAAVRAVVVAVLHELGYRLVEAAEADAALRILETPHKLDLLVTDVGLPGLNGRQLAEIARQRRPDLPVLFITGYAAGAARRTELVGPGMEMISKPFAVEAFAQMVREMLEATPSPVSHAQARDCAAASRPLSRTFPGAAMSEPVALCLASICYGGVARADYMRSLMALRLACAKAGIPLTLELGGGEALIGRARAGMLSKFLASEASHLLFADNEKPFDPAEVFDLIGSNAGVAATPDDRLFLIRRDAAQALAAAHPELHARLGDLRGADDRLVPLLFETLLVDGRPIDDLAAFLTRWQALRPDRTAAN